MLPADGSSAWTSSDDRLRASYVIYDVLLNYNMISTKIRITDGSSAWASSDDRLRALPICPSNTVPACVRTYLPTYLPTHLPT